MSAHDIQKDIPKYIGVGVALFVLTIVTVGASYLSIGLVLGIVLALVIACIKGSMVGGFFMHLIGEKKTIYILLGFTAFFFLSMLFLIYVSQFDVYQGLEYLPNGDQSVHHSGAVTGGHQAAESTGNGH